MKIIAISSAKPYPQEAELAAEMLEEGLDNFHLRKRDTSEKELRGFLKKIPERFYPKIFIHSHYSLALIFGLGGIHLTRKKRMSRIRTGMLLRFYRFLEPGIRVSTSFHTLASLCDDSRQYDYVFLSPVFDSISKARYPGNFTGYNFAEVLGATHHKVVALGGVAPAKVEALLEMRFFGIALHGALWTSANPLDVFRETKALVTSTANGRFAAEKTPPAP